MRQTICIKNVFFQKITKDAFYKINKSNIKFIFISNSGMIDAPGNVYIFTSQGGFFFNKKRYADDFIDKYLSLMRIQNWNITNLYFCDYLIINPKIYNSFIQELCERNIRDFWFETAIYIYKKMTTH